MEAVIWSPLTITVENAYRWRMTRVAESGVPEFDEAFGIYSQLNPEWLKLNSVQEAEQDFSGEPRIAPQYPLTQADEALFFSRCLSLLDDEKRLELIRWELVGLANKVMVADRRDPSLMQDRLDAMQKALGYVNIGLELGADGDPKKGQKLLSCTWMRFLFQAGYSRLKKLKWRAQKFLRENKTWIDSLITTSDAEQLSALIYRFPQIGRSPSLGASLEWKDFQTLEEVLSMEQFLDRGVFFARFSRQCLDLSPGKIENYKDESSIPENNGDIDLLVWATTALARFTLFKEISCEPLQEAAARSFLEIIFLASIYKEDPKVCDEARMSSFHQQLLKAPMAWTERDLELLMELLIACRENLERQFGRLNPKGKIEWKFTQALLIRL
jgi:hypothetical protein